MRKFILQLVALSRNSEEILVFYSIVERAESKRIRQVKNLPQLRIYLQAGLTEFCFHFVKKYREIKLQNKNIHMNH